VAEPTRRRILAEAERLGYLPDPAARRLITGRSGNIGLIVPDLANPFFSDTAKGVEREARATRLGLFISDTDEQDRLEPDAVRRICRQVDGLIWASPRNADEVLLQFAGTVPTVLLHRQLEGWWSVSTDLADGMRQALVNLHSLGHRRIAYAGGPEQSWSGQQRLRGLMETSEELGVEIMMLGSFAPNSDGGSMVADVVLSRDVSALIAYNDAIALGALSRLASRGVDVPGDLSIISCDDIAYAKLSAPPLTTVHVPRHEAGAAAVDLLQELMANPDAPPVAKVMATQLVIRGTTAPVA
jgi:DNA-binding LacI/PurR family transcriptional regulator